MIGNIVRKTQDMLLVEWIDENGILQRHWVTHSMTSHADSKNVDVKSPRQGIPYGIDFTYAFSHHLGKAVNRELRKRGLWTYADLQANPQGVLSALQSAYGSDLAKLLQFAKEYEKNVE